MAIKSAVVDSKAKTLTLVLDLNESGAISKSGKSLVHASTQGNKVTDQILNGKPLVVGVNAYTPVN